MGFYGVYPSGMVNKYRKVTIYSGIIYPLNKVIFHSEVKLLEGNDDLSSFHISEVPCVVLFFSSLEFRVFLFSGLYGIIMITKIILLLA